MEQLLNLKFAHDIWVFLLPLALMVADIITGYYNAWKNKQVSSSKMRDGLGKKMAELVYIVVGMLMSFAFSVKPVEYFISLYVIYMEIVSIAENCKKLGIDIPLSELQDKLKENKND